MSHKIAPSYALTQHFTENLGIFYGLWIALEATIEHQIGRLLKIAHIETHILIAGMEFGRKANLFRILIMRENGPNAEKIATLLNKLQNEAKRNIFTHSIVHSVMDQVTFIHRKIDNKFSATTTTFTSDEFENHVRNMVSVANEFGRLLNIDQADFQSFCDAASNA